MFGKQSFQEIIRYLVAGVLTTLVNLLVLSLLTNTFGFEYKYIFNTIAIVCAIIFAFFINRYYVFHSDGPIGQEFLSFFGSRILISLVFDNGFYWLFSDLIGVKGMVPVLRVEWSKLIGQVLVVIANYLAGKFLVFRHHGSKDGAQATDKD
ncbi:MAG: GtrA family protein [Eubacteriales bacterium]|nr:GtrA family protein [Eubacteriales bacterium]